MYIARRTGGGRGVYELAGSNSDGLKPSDIEGRELCFEFTPYLRLSTHVELAIQGGKPRLRLISDSNSEDIQIQRQMASILLLPKPIRADDAMSEDERVIVTDGFVAERIDLDDTIDTHLDRQVILRPTSLTVKNQLLEKQIDIRLRIKRIVSLWSAAGKFPSEIRALLLQHRNAFLNGVPQYSTAENIVSELQSKMNLIYPTYDGISDPLLVLDQIPIELTVVLCSKPLAILTGPSGTGKSRVGIDLATSFDYSAALPESLKASSVRPATCLAFVPIGAGWTDQTKLLGYRNPFGPKRRLPDGNETNLTYHITDTIKVMLRAWHPFFQNNPHFLILDEMNLSHVERYFSSFLSLMEADQSSVGDDRFELVSSEDIRLIRDILSEVGDSPIELESADYLLSRKQGLSFPPNLYVIGTVNVDETTYMFSPKVLDRAFVMELHSSQPATYLTNEVGDTKPMIQGVVAQWLFSDYTVRHATRNTTTLALLFSSRLEKLDVSDKHISAILQNVSVVLDGIYELLKPVGFDFGFRVTKEILVYIATWVDALIRNGEDIETIVSKWPSAMDNAVLMKVLPKIHGNSRQLGDSLLALSEFLSGSGPQEVSYQVGAAPVVRLGSEQRPEFALPRSSAKAVSLHYTLQATGHTTFIS